MEERKTIREIGENIIAEMERMQYAPLTMEYFRYDVRRLADFARQRTGEEFFSEELGRIYLADTIGYPITENRWLTTQEAARVRCVRRIGEYQLYKTVRRNYAQKAKVSDNWKLGDEKIISAYIESVQTADNSEATKKLRIHHIRQFYEFLTSRKATGIYDISAQLISDYAASLQGDSPVYTKHRLATLRFYFRFLHQNGCSATRFLRNADKINEKNKRHSKKYFRVHSFAPTTSK